MLSLLLTLAVQATADVDVLVRLAGVVAAERAAVESTAEDLAARRAASRDELSALQRRRADLEGRLADAALLQRELQARADVATRGQTADRSARSLARAPLRVFIDGLKERISTVPFRTGSRLEALAVVERALDGRSVSTSTSALWSLLLQEARLLDETAGARQPIVVGGSTVMAEVAHVGPLVWFRSKDGVSGVADHGAWRVIDDVEGRQRIAFFFDALRRDQATGLFLLPSPSAEVPR